MCLFVCLFVPSLHVFTWEPAFQQFQKFSLSARHVKGPGTLWNDPYHKLTPWTLRFGYSYCCYEYQVWLELGFQSRWGSLLSTGKKRGFNPEKFLSWDLAIPGKRQHSLSACEETVWTFGKGNSQRHLGSWKQVTHEKQNKSELGIVEKKELYQMQ